MNHKSNTYPFFSEQSKIERNYQRKDYKIFKKRKKTVKMSIKKGQKIEKGLFRRLF